MKKIMTEILNKSNELYRNNTHRSKYLYLQQSTTSENMNNIFKDAYFGKMYKTRDGKKAVLISLSNFSAQLSMELDNPGYITSITITCGLDGKITDKFLSSDQDIVSEWEEDIDEDDDEDDFPYGDGDVFLLMTGQFIK